MKMTNFLFSLSASCILLATCAQARVCFVVGGCDGDTKKVAATKDCRKLGYTYTSCPGNQTPVSECKDNGTTYYRCACDTNVYNLQEYPASAYIQVPQADGSYISKFNTAYKGKEMCGDSFRALCNDSYRYVDDETSTGKVEFGKITSHCGTGQEPNKSDYCIVISGEGRGTKLYKSCTNTCEYLYSYDNVQKFDLTGKSCQREENGRLVTFYESIKCPASIQRGGVVFSGIIEKSKCDTNSNFYASVLTPNDLSSSVRNSLLSTDHLNCGVCEPLSSKCTSGLNKAQCKAKLEANPKSGKYCRKVTLDGYPNFDCYEFTSGGVCPTNWYQNK